jgi:hypothetical protein
MGILLDVYISNRIGRKTIKGMCVSTYLSDSSDLCFFVVPLEADINRVSRRH